MEDDATAQKWKVLQKDDADLMNEIETLLAARIAGNPYSSDGSFAEELTKLPIGLRAMAATHWLDLSLTLDSITWHFGNFGEPHLVAQTEAGLRELGLHELATCFQNATELMLPLVPQMAEADGDFEDFLEQKGIRHAAEQLDERGWELKDSASGKAAIYEAWVQYARKHPERVFET